MTLATDVPLGSLTTFHLGGPARYVATCENESDVREALRYADEEKIPWYVLGEGSNLLVGDKGYPGLIIKMGLARTAYMEDENGMFLVAEAGVTWDTLVTETTRRGLWGIENLAGIPGSAGAAPVQNIGAYGMELAESLLWVEALSAVSGEVVRIPVEECRFGYRDSRFKHESDLIIVRIALRVRDEGAPRVNYADLVRAGADGAALSTPEEVASAVRLIRSKKFPDLAVCGTAGSFFKNPIISTEAYGKLKEKYPELPGFPGKTGVKVPLAWILDRVLSLKGESRGAARLFEAQPLVIVTESGAKTSDVEELAKEVTKRVKEATGITIEREVRTLA